MCRGTSRSICSGPIGADVYPDSTSQGPTATKKEHSNSQQSIGSSIVSNTVSHIGKPTGWTPCLHRNLAGLHPARGACPAMNRHINHGDPVCSGSLQTSSSDAPVEQAQQEPICSITTRSGERFADRRRERAGTGPEVLPAGKRLSGGPCILT